MPFDLTKMICKKCGNLFCFSLLMPLYPNERALKEINCPWCGEKNGSLTTQAEIISRRVTDKPTENIPFGKIKWYK